VLCLLEQHHYIGMIREKALLIQRYVYRWWRQNTNCLVICCQLYYNLSVGMFQHFDVYVHCESKKNCPTFIFTVTLANVGRFLKFFQCRNQKETAHNKNEKFSHCSLTLLLRYLVKLTLVWMWTITTMLFYSAMQNSSKTWQRRWQN